MIKSIICLLLLTGCTATIVRYQNENTIQENTEYTPVCLDSNNETLECESSDDCCEGFGCSTIPDVSYRKKYCVFIGK